SPHASHSCDVIFFTSFSGTCCRIIEMILVILTRRQMNVLKSNLLLNFCTKNHLVVAAQYAG
ncbi:hypothetical protein ACP1N1_004459, partial [Klebsiella pneumoniae]|nr:hypothetical protein [Pseudomonas aeruginosa]